MDLARKLQLAPGQRLAVLGVPADVDRGDVSIDPAGTAVLVFRADAGRHLGSQPARQVAINGIWSALRFRPA